MMLKLKLEKLGASRAECGERMLVTRVKVAELASPLCPVWANTPDIK